MATLALAHAVAAVLCAGVLVRAARAPGPVSTRAANAVHVATFPVSHLAPRFVPGASSAWPGALATCAAGLVPWTAGLGVLLAVRRARRTRIEPSVRGGSAAPAAGRGECAGERVGAIGEPEPAEQRGSESVGRSRLTRRLFLAEAACAGGVLGASASGAHATLVGPWDLRVRRYTVPIAGLPAWADGLRIVQLSDTHLGPCVPEDHVAAAVGIACDLRPDVLALTGDFIERGPSRVDRLAELLGPCVAAARLGTCGVLGNHDWVAGGPRVASALRAAGVLMLDNARTFLTPDGEYSPVERPGSLCIAGFGDLWQDVVRADAALGGVGPQTPRLVLSHNPDAAELPEVARHRVDCMLSGHTHGGQVRVPLLGEPVVPSDFGRRYAGGLCRAGGVAAGFPVVVSRGVGMSGVPVRVNCPPEVVEVTLVRG